MFRVAICDDNNDFLLYEKKLVCGCLSEVTKNYRCDSFASGNDLLSLGTDIDKYDMIILDCKMDIIDGVKTAEEIRMHNEKVKILFSTDYYEFSQNACDVEPIGYLIKNSPDYESILCKKTQLVYKKASDQQRYITDFSDGTHKVNVKDIVYINSFDHYLYFHIRSRGGSRQLMELKRRAKLDDIIDSLGDSFVKANVSYLVNMAYVTSIVSGKICVNCGCFNTKISIRRGDIDSIEEMFNKYLGTIEW